MPELTPPAPTNSTPSTTLPPKIVKVSEELSCELNEVEWQNKARELAEAHKKVADQEQRKKDVMKELGHDVSAAKTTESKLADAVSTKRELRTVTVEVKYDYDKGVVTRIRTDTNEVIGEREITDAERQADLDLFHDANDVIEGIAMERDKDLIGDDDDDLDDEEAEALENKQNTAADTEEEMDDEDDAGDLDDLDESDLLEDEKPDDKIDPVKG